MPSSQKLRNIDFRGTENCNFCLLCHGASGWMLQDMDNMVASCIFYVKVRMFTCLEQRKPSFLSGNKLELVRLTVKHNLCVSLSFMYFPGNALRQTSADVRCLKQCLIYSCNSCDFGCRERQCIPVNQQTTSDQHFSHIRAVGNHCNFQLYAVGFLLSIMTMLAANYSTLT